MPLINLLSQDTIDKIAAGEVVERPLSVVKELTENAIDAGACAITVEIKEGGISLIRVTDNGCGIGKNQVKKAFLRHATSKIASIDDLNQVASLGFRGEALSSIAAVAQVEAITKTAEELTGIRYVISGGREECFDEIGAPVGTTFLVRNLFFNIPVRRKFLKQPSTEGSYVADMMEHLALSHPERSIKFIQNGQLKFHTSGNGDLKEVIYRIYGRDMASALTPFQMETEVVSVSGFLGKPEICRANRNLELYFVNGRYVKNDIITRTLEEGYRTYLMQHKFPVCILHFQMDPGFIDVNVHPSKMEIRLLNGSVFFQLVSGAVRESLHQLEMIPSVQLSEKDDWKADRKEKSAAIKTPEPFEVKRSAMLMESPAGYNITGSKQKQAFPDQAGSEAKAFENLNEIPVQDEQQKKTGNRILGVEGAGQIRENEGIHSNLIKADAHVLVEKPVQLSLFEDKFLTPEARKNYRILGQIFDTYWLAAFQDRLFIIDQHAAHEKVRYERLVKELETKNVTAQQLNPPVIVTLTGREEEVLKQYTGFFRDMGFEMEEFGGSSYAIRSMPVDLYGCNEKEFFTNILDELADAPVRGTPEVILQKLASMACKSAVKGNNQLSIQEIEALIDELLGLENPYHCPHGRPTIISMSKYEIERKFKRIV